MSVVAPVLATADLVVHYPLRGARGRERPVLRAVDGVSLDLYPGEALGLVGESGCGKSTLARALVGLEEPTGGQVLVDGAAQVRRPSRAERRRVQMVFQDPTLSLNPRLTVRQVLRELLLVHRLVDRSAAEDRCRELVDLVGLPVSALDAYPRQLSGGQRQRVGIARALALEPEVIVADEPVSALDVSVQATIVNLLADLRTRLGVALLLISHDLGVVRHLCDRVAVMYLGRVVEVGPTEELFARPEHPYTRALLRAAPSLLEVRPPGGSGLAGDPPSPVDLPPGCRFRGRCPLAHEACAEEPQLLPTPHGRPEVHASACHAPPPTAHPHDLREDR